MKGIVNIIIVALLLAGATYILTLITPVSWTNHFLINIGFLVFLTIVSDSINQKALEQTGRGVIIPYIVSTILKLVFSAVFLILFIKENKESAREIVFSFLFYYSVLSALEIIIVNKRLKAKKF